MKNIPKLIPVAYFKAYKDDDTLVWGEDCVSATNDFEEADYTGVALVRLSDVAALSEVECENCNQLVRALREAVEGPTFMGEPVFTPTSGAAVKAEPDPAVAILKEQLNACVATLDGYYKADAPLLGPSISASMRASSNHAHNLALELETLLYWVGKSSPNQDSAFRTLEAYRKEVREAQESDSPTFMGEPATPQPPTAEPGQTNEQGRAADVAVSDEQVNRALNAYMDGSHATGNAAMRAALEQFVSHQPPASPVAVPEGFKLLKDSTYAERSYEYGDYYCMCCTCLRQFAGQKRQQVCKFCSTTQTPLQPLADSRGSDEVGV